MEPGWPDFLVLGPHKSATTTLHNWILQHPYVVRAPLKELRYFNRDQPATDYSAYFPVSGLLKPHARVGEASPRGLFSSSAIAAAQQYFPDVRTIAMLRDPVARAYSHYRMNVEQDGEPRTFGEAIDEMLELLGDTPLIDPDDPRLDMTFQPVRFLFPGCVVPWIRRWVEATSAEQLLLVESDALRSRPVDALNEIYDHLGLPPHRISEPVERNVRSYDAIDPVDAERLRAWYEPHQAALAELVANHPRVVRS